MDSSLTLLLCLSNCCSSNTAEGFNIKELTYSLNNIEYLFSLKNIIIKIITSSLTGAKIITQVAFFAGSIRYKLPITKVPVFPVPNQYYLDSYTRLGLSNSIFTHNKGLNCFLLNSRRSFKTKGKNTSQEISIKIQLFECFDCLKMNHLTKILHPNSIGYRGYPLIFIMLIACFFFFLFKIKDLIF